jgi:hypothetical protein
MMPGKRWSREERQLLRRQIHAGVLLSSVVVPNRTTNGIVYQLRELNPYPTSRWKTAEVNQIRKEAKAGKPPWKISIPGRSSFAIRNKMLRLKLWKPKPHPQRPWLRRELDRLKYLVVDCGYTAREAVANGYFPSRSVNSVAQQMRRNAWKRNSTDVPLQAGPPPY